MLLNKELKPQIICIVGPTASGKSSLAVELAKKIDAQIISADSMQIYRNLDVGTAKVTESEKQGVKHYMIDICEIDQKYSVAEFKSDCYKCIKQIIDIQKNVIIVGGTGLYISAVVNDMQFENNYCDEKFREELIKLASLNSNEYVHNILNELDPESAAKIHPNNLKRVIRAIEYAKFMDKTKTQHMDMERIRIEENINSDYDFKVFFLNLDREKLYEKINLRVDLMMKDGLLKEAKKLYDMNLPKSLTCMQAIGYKEFFDYFENNKTLVECVDKLKQNTRNYAKRQITWFKNMNNIYELNAIIEKDQLCDKIMECLNEKE